MSQTCMTSKFRWTEMVSPQPLIRNAMTQRKARSLSGIVFVTRRRRRGQMRGRRPEKTEVYSLVYIEDFFGSRTAQMVVDRSPQ